MQGWSRRGSLKPGRGLCPFNNTLSKTEGMYLPSLCPVLREKEMAAEFCSTDITQNALRKYPLHTPHSGAPSSAFPICLQGFSPALLYPKWGLAEGAVSKPHT